MEHPVSACDTTADEEFFDKITHIQQKLYKIAFCYVKSESAALEIVSQTVYKAYLSFSTLKNKAYFNSWMTRILINESISMLRKNKKLVPLESHEPTLRVFDTLCIEQRIDLYDALDMISPEDKSYIILKYFEEMTFREISQITGKSENTIKTKIYRILKKLKKLLDDSEAT